MGLDTVRSRVRHYDKIISERRFPLSITGAQSGMEHVRDNEFNATGTLVRLEVIFQVYR